MAPSGGILEHWPKGAEQSVKGPHVKIACLLLAFLILAPVLTSCRGEEPAVGGGGTAAEAGREPFVTWDRTTTIPFLLLNDTLYSDTYYLGLWDLEAARVSLETSPLFSVNEQSGYDIYWDGGDRFGFLPRYPGSFSVTGVDPRVRVDVFREPASLIVCPSDGGTFIVCLEEGNRIVLDIRDHPLAGKAVLSTDLAPGTKLAQVIGLEAGDEKVRVYCVTLRTEPHESNGESSYEYVHGILEATYAGTDSPVPQRWRMVHPDIEVTYAGAGPSFTPYGQTLFIHERCGTRALDLVTGKIEPFTAGLEELKGVDPNYTQAASPDIEIWGENSYTCAGCLVLRSLYLWPEHGIVEHFIAFKDGKVVGRLRVVDGRFEVFKGDDKTFEAVFPRPLTGIRFPVDMQRTELPEGSVSEAAGKTFGPDEFNAIWMHARYPDLFNEALRCDGWKSEQMGLVLMRRFEEGPLDFLRALGGAYPKEVERVGDLLAYNASYGDLNAFRERIESLRQQLSKEEELHAVDIILDRIDKFKSGETR
ncbi:MAG TPA: hypothetical protein GX510_05475 [Firmicutes bacterium]|nr:hypothetical protein [Candidatus Fermentithermobacillaceae bacterium]